MVWTNLIRWNFFALDVCSGFVKNKKWKIESCPLNVSDVVTVDVTIEKQGAGGIKEGGRIS